MNPSTGALLALALAHSGCATARVTAREVANTPSVTPTQSEARVRRDEAPRTAAQVTTRPAVRSPEQTRQRDAAIALHQGASRARREAMEAALRSRAARRGEREELRRRAADLLRDARREYDAAALAYGAFLTAWPDDADANELRFSRADALFWGARYVDAAQAFDAVCDADREGRLAVAAAYMAVMAREAQLREEVRAHRVEACIAVRGGLSADGLVDDEGARLLDARQAAPCEAPPEGDTRIEIPPAVTSLMEARAAYVRRVPGPVDTAESLREVLVIDPDHVERNPPFSLRFEHVNARALLRFGHLVDAERALRSVLQVRCGGVLLADAFRDLSLMLERQGRGADLEAVRRDQIEHPCVCAHIEAEPVRSHKGR